MSIISQSSLFLSFFPSIWLDIYIYIYRYGHECFFSFKGKETQVYYIPYLSAIQLFVHDSDLQAELLLNSNNLPNNLPKDHQNSEETATSNCSSSPVFEFYETSSPNERIPLVDKVNPIIRP